MIKGETVEISVNLLFCVKKNPKTVSNIFQVKYLIFLKINNCLFSCCEQN